MELHLEPDTMLGTILRHPLVYSIPYFPPMAGMMNRSLYMKREMLQAAKIERNWESYVFLHERPHRLPAFMRMQDEMTDAEFWTGLRGVWIDSENIQAFAVEWADLWGSERGSREVLMTAEEAGLLAAMGDEFTVWQGHTTERTDGWSWTVNPATAKWFANRFAALEGGEAVVSRGRIRRSDVVAYFTSRGENEILVNPSSVRIN